MTTLEELRDTVIVDEIQRRPDLFQVLRVLADRKDLLLFKNGRRLGIEIKRADAPTITASLRSALADLKLEQFVVLCPGSRTYELEPGVRVLPIDALAGQPSTLCSQEATGAHRAAIGLGADLVK